MKSKMIKTLFLLLVTFVTKAQGTDPHGTAGTAITGMVSTEINTTTANVKKPAAITYSRAKEIPEYFHLRPQIEKAYGYSHAVKIGNTIKISGAVSMNDEGNPTAVGDFEQQMKNCYSDLDKILKHYGCTFDDVVKEDVFTTDMQKFLEFAGYRAEIYKKQFPTGSWLGVKELAVPEFMIEIELEVHKIQ